MQRTPLIKTRQREAERGLPRSSQRKGAATPIKTTMDVSHGRSARMSFDTAREMAKTLTPAQEIAHIENELRALGYTKTHQPVKEALTMKNPQYNPSTKTLEELRLQRRTATGVLPKSMEETMIEKEVQEDGKVYRNARACTGGDLKMRYPGPHDRPKKDDIIPHYETPTKTKHVKGSGRRSASNNDDAEYWSDDGGSWQRSNKDSPGARRVGKSQGSPESISKSSLKKFQWRRKRREWSAERGDERGDNWRGSDAYGNDPDFSGGKYRRGGEYAKDIVGF